MNYLAIFALALTYLVWASFLVSARSAMLSPLGPVELGLLRFLVPAIIFLPILFRHGAIPAKTKPIDIILIGFCGGLFVFAPLSIGLSIAPVADSAIFAPSMLPLYVAVLSYFFLNERFGIWRILGILLILVGAGLVGGWDAMMAETPGVWRGHLMFMLGSFCWSIYTIRFRKIGISPSVAAMMICVWTAIAYTAIALFTGADFSGVSGSMLLWLILIQGILAGVVALITYSYAVKQLGASVSAAFAAIVPVLTAIGGYIFLGETLSDIKIAGICVVSLGVLLASGILRRRSNQPPAEPPLPDPKARRGSEKHPRFLSRG